MRAHRFAVKRALEAGLDAPLKVREDKIPDLFSTRFRRCPFGLAFRYQNLLPLRKTNEHYHSRCIDPRWLCVRLRHSRYRCNGRTSFPISGGRVAVALCPLMMLLPRRSTAQASTPG